MKLIWIMPLIAATAALICWVMYEFGLTDWRKKQTPDNNKIRVACVGDSITYGCLVPLRGRNHYPRVLQKMLGEGYQVENFGLSNRTLQMTGDEPYQLEKEFPRSLMFRPNIVILKLGTNDTKPQNWRSADVFESEYRLLLAHYQALASTPKIYLCTPAAAYTGPGAKNGVYSYKIREKELEEARAVVRRLAVEMGLGLIDTAVLTAGHPEWFAFDGIHPNAKGTRAIAEAVYRAVTGSTENGNQSL